MSSLPFQCTYRNINLKTLFGFRWFQPSNNIFSPLRRISCDPKEQRTYTDIYIQIYIWYTDTYIHSHSYIHGLYSRISTNLLQTFYAVLIIYMKYMYINVYISMYVHTCMCDGTTSLLVNSYAYASKLSSHSLILNFIWVNVIWFSCKCIPLGST